MSTLLLNTLTGKTSAGSIVVTGEGGSETTNLQSGLAKARGQHAAGTLQSGSLNHSSITDNGVGIFTHNFTNSFSNILYSHVGSATHNGGSSSALWTYMRFDGASSDTATGSIKVTSAYVNATSNRTDYDFAFADLLCFGDLA